MWSSTTDQWRFKIWIKELKLEHWKSPCSVCLMWSVFYLMAKKKKNLGHDFQWVIFEIMASLEAFPRIIVPGHYSSNDTVGSTTFYFWPKQNVPQPLLFSPRSFWKNNLALASSSWSSTRSGESCKLPQPHQCNRTRRKWFRDSWFHHLMTGAVYQWFKISLMVWKPSGKVVDADNDAMTNGANRRRNTAGQRWTAIVLNRGRG